MKLKYELSYIDLDGTPMAIPVGCEEEFRGVLHMNQTTADILRCLEADVTEDEVVAALKQEYDAAEDEIRARVQEAVRLLRENGLLSE